MDLQGSVKKQFLVQAMDVCSSLGLPDRQLLFTTEAIPKMLSGQRVRRSSAESRLPEKSLPVSEF